MVGMAGCRWIAGNCSTIAASELLNLELSCWKTTAELGARGFP